MPASKPVNRFLTDDGEEAKAVEINPDKWDDPIHPARQNAYRMQVRKALAAARYRDWLKERRRNG